MKDRVVVRLAQLLLLTVISIPVRAEVFNCDGVWKDRPCASILLPKQKLQATNPNSDTPEERRKEKLLRNAKQTMWRLEGRYARSIYLPIALAIENCSKLSVDACDRELLLAAYASETLKNEEDQKRAALDAKLQAIALEREEEEQRHQDQLRLEQRINDLQSEVGSLRNEVNRPW